MIEFPIIYADGEQVTKEDFLQFREAIIQLRDAALKSNNFDWAVKLSHLIKLMSFLGDVK